MHRAWRAVTGPVAALTLLVVLAVGCLAVTAGGSWEGGLIAFGAVLALAAVLRAGLPRARLGPLVVRSTAFDVTVLAVLAIAIVALSLDLPH